MSDENHRSDVPRRSVIAVSLGAGLLTAIVGAAVVLAAPTLRSSDDASLLGALPALLLLAGHLWAGRWRVVLALLLTLVPAALLLGVTVSTARSDDGAAFGLVGVGLATVLVLGTAALATWVANRWGRRRPFSLSDLGHMPA